MDTDTTRPSRRREATSGNTTRTAVAASAKPPNTAPMAEAPAQGAVGIHADARLHAGLFDGTEAADESCFAMVLAHYQCQGGRCASPELLRGNTPADWWIWPTAQGLAVSPDPYPEVARSCRGEHVVLPWQRVRTTLIKPQALP